MALVTDEHSVDLSDAEQALMDIQPAYRLYDDEPLNDLLTTIVNELQRIDLEIDELYDQRFIETATGKELGRLGNNVGIDRKTGESDSKYRKRIRAGYAAAISRGTHDDIGRVVLELFDYGPEKFDLVMASDTQDPATALLKVEGVVLDNTPFTNSEILDILGDAIVGGHKLTLQRTDVFTWDDSSRGWGTQWANILDT